ncbi:hypothetical protein F2Q69_00022845 [Brassica cretica]|uniref:Uncharacterized protein n=1 Tax=Brassica cretica TaxID=69181 RepID=A0A8S9QEM2_BRACR|nr:hypothetical protein F2Q69_00022845 [Brassica cretica]
MDFHSGLRVCLLIAFSILVAPLGGTLSMFVLVLGDNLVDSGYQSRILGHVATSNARMALCRAFLEDRGHVFPESEDIEIHPSETHGSWVRFFINWRLYGLSSRNLETGWTFVLSCGNPEVLLSILRSYLDPEVLWEPGGSPFDPEIVSRPGGHVVTRRFFLGPEILFGNRRLSKDPKVVWEPGGCSRPGGRFEPGGYSGPGVSSRPGGHFEPENRSKNPEYLVLHGPYSAFLGKTTTVPVRISHSATRKLATIEFLCCILLLHEVTDRLTGCWCGCYDPSAKLCCFPRMEKQGMDAWVGAEASLNRNLEAGILPEAWMIFPNQFAPYFSISSSDKGNNMCTQVNRSCSFSAGFPWAGHRSSNPSFPGEVQDLGCIPLDVKTYSRGSWPEVVLSWLAQDLMEKRSMLQWASTSACQWRVGFPEIDMCLMDIPRHVAGLGDLLPHSEEGILDLGFTLQIYTLTLGWRSSILGSNRVKTVIFLIPSSGGTRPFVEAWRPILRPTTLRLSRASCSDPVGPVDFSWRFRGLNALTPEDLWTTLDVDWMWVVVEIAPVASVEPFGIPSKSIGQLRGNRTFVGRVVLQFLVLLVGLKSFHLVMLDVSYQNPSITEISS